MGRSRSRSRSRDRRRRSRSRDRRRDCSRSRDRDRPRRDERRRSRSRDRRRSRSKDRRRDRSDSRGRDAPKSRDRSPSKSQSASMPSSTAGDDEKRQARLAKLAAWKQQQQQEVQAAAPPTAPAAAPSGPPTKGIAVEPSASVPSLTVPAWNAARETAAAPSTAASHLAPAPGYAAQQAQQPAAAPAAAAPAEQEGLIEEEGDDDIDPLDAFMAAEVLPEVKAKEEEEKRKREEERVLLQDLIQKGKVPKILEPDSDEEPEADVEIQIPAHKVKLVVGAGGEKIKWIQRKSKCRIQVKKDEGDLNKAFGTGPTLDIPLKGPKKEGDQVKMATLQLFGSAEQCDSARALIDEAVDNREQKQKQRQKEYEKKKDAKWRDRQIYHMRHAKDYEVLGLPLGASKADIKAAFRKMALRWHPDKNRDNLEEAEARFQEISRAYESLMSTDEDTRVEQIGL